MISYASFAFFILYFGITYLIYSLVPKNAKWAVLLSGSFFFYFVSAKGNVIPILLTTVIIWITGLAIQKINDVSKEKRKQAPKEHKKIIKSKYKNYSRIVLTVGIIFSLSILLVCKYSNFFIDTTNSIFLTSISNVKIAQPLGISFYTLQAISYIADIYYGRVKAEKNPLRVALYLSFMLTVVEGPIARYTQIGEQFNNLKKIDAHDLINGIVRICYGLFKKIVIADRLAMLASAVFDNYDSHSGIAIVIGILAYTFQLYLEFSGIIDVVIGLGETMSIVVPENFNQPFFAKSINEFWQRWHITLGSWLRDYIFYPISLTKPMKKMLHKEHKHINAYYSNLIPISIALFFVWLGNGFWHGSGWKYICYGLYYYVLMMIAQFLEPMFVKICGSIKLDRTSKAYGYFQIARTFLIVNIGMLIFRADDLGVAVKMFKSMFAKGSLSFLNSNAPNTAGLDVFDYSIIIIGILFVFVVELLKENKIDLRQKISSLPYIVRFIIYMLFIYAIILFGAYGEGYKVADLIYANF